MTPAPPTPHTWHVILACGKRLKVDVGLAVCSIGSGERVSSRLQGIGLQRYNARVSLYINALRRRYRARMRYYDDEFLLVEARVIFTALAYAFISETRKNFKFHLDWKSWIYAHFCMRQIFFIIPRENTPRVQFLLSENVTFYNLINYLLTFQRFYVSYTGDEFFSHL